MSKAVLLVGLCCLLSSGAWSVESMENAGKCEIQIIDRSNQWPVPLVELITTHHLCFVSDNAGVIAMDAPELLGRETWFEVRAHGYEVPKDGFGYRGVRLKPEPGKVFKVMVDRTIVAQRMGRLTGAGLFAESQKLGRGLDWVESGIVGCDSVLNAMHNGKYFWVWGDTTLGKYPLGIFNGTGAVTPEQPLAGFAPPVKLKLDYFRDAGGNPRGIAVAPGKGPTWLTGMISLPDAQGKARLVAAYSKITPPMDAYEWSLAAWNESSQVFEQLKVIWRKDQDKPRPVLPEGHVNLWKDSTGKQWALFGNPFPRLKCPATFEQWQNPEAWETVEAPESVVGLAGGQEVKVTPHTGSIAWLEGRGRWAALFMQAFGKPSAFGEIWYCESDSPFGPWSRAVKVVKHDDYTFYNPRMHPGFSAGHSNWVFFEGTYTREFSNNKSPTPRYDYNQVLYRLDLDDPRVSAGLKK
jgi:hypothetical protein